jgi:AraC family transcriptional regulator
MRAAVYRPAASATDDCRLTTQIYIEKSWQKAPVQPDASSAKGRIVLSRWAHEPMQISSDAPTKSHFITYAVRQADVSFSVGRKVLRDGPVRPRQILLQSPTADARHCSYRSPFDFFRVYFSSTLLQECVEAVTGRCISENIILFDAHFVTDPTLESLSQVLMDSGGDSSLYGPTFTDGVSLALAAHLLGRYTAAPKSVRPPGALAKPKLGRVTDYIESKLHLPIYLSELAAMVDLSQMHFAAQFRQAAGVSPTAYILRRRVERAGELMAQSTLPTAEVATLVGFRSAAHLSTAFRRHLGLTPSAWRRAHRR